MWAFFSFISFSYNTFIFPLMASFLYRDLRRPFCNYVKLFPTFLYAIFMSAFFSLISCSYNVFFHISSDGQLSTQRFSLLIGQILSTSSVHLSIFPSHPFCLSNIPSYTEPHHLLSILSFSLVSHTEVSSLLPPSPPAPRCVGVYSVAAVTRRRNLTVSGRGGARVLTCCRCLALVCWRRRRKRCWWWWWRKHGNREE